MRFYGRSPEQAVQETIRDYRQAAGYIKPLRDTLDKYAGKVYNFMINFLCKYTKF